ncbi:MAG: KaiC domain-containing protein [Halodesulfurarchaeum sp.]
MAEDASADDDDWFERALEEDEEGTEDLEDHADREDQGPDERGDGEDAEPAGDADETKDAMDTGSDAGPGTPDEVESGPSAGGTDVADLESAFERGAADEPGGAADEPGGAADESGGAADEPGGAADEPGAVSGPEDPFEGEPEFDVDQGGQEQFGFDLGDDSAAGFEAEEYRTELERIDVGIEGLDEMIQGGVPKRSLIVTVGGAGTGKTTFGLQFLQRALENDERAVFISLEESRERILQTAREKGWEFEAAEAAGDLAVIDLDPVDMANSLTSIRNELPRLVEDFGASRLVLDSVSLLEMMYDQQATRRTEIYDFARSLKEAGVTTMLTSEADEDNPYASRYGIIEYLTDAVFVLRYVRPDDFRETRLAIEIQKIRDANHSRETKPYEITNTGISVYRQANIF